MAMLCFRPSIPFFLIVAVFFSLLISSASTNHGVFSVKNKYAGQERTLVVLKAHDSRRQLHFLASVDLSLGGSGRPNGVGYGVRQYGDLSSSNEEALDGILGFRKANSSMISQLASFGKVKKIFAYCLNGVNGCGIFAIGHVVQPKVNMTPLLTDQPHYNVNMTRVQVGHAFLSLPIDDSEVGYSKGTIINSGTTLAYLPEWIYEPLVNKIIAEQPGLKVQTLHNEYTCFQYLER